MRQGSSFILLQASLIAQLVKNSPAGSIPGLGRFPGEGKGYPLQYSGLENSMDSPWDHKELDMSERLSLSLIKTLWSFTLGHWWHQLYFNFNIYHQMCVVLVVQSLSHVQLFATPWTAAHQAPLSSTFSELAQIHVHWVSDTIQPSHPLSPPSPPALNLSQHQGLFQWVGSSYQVVIRKFKIYFPAGTETGPPALEAQSLSHWTMKELCGLILKSFNFNTW